MRRWMSEEEPEGQSGVDYLYKPLTARREAIEAEELAQERRLNPKLSTQFADLKRTLATLSDADWNSIPETSNMTGKRRKHNLRLEENQSGKMYAVSDTVLADAAGRNTVLGELDQAQQEVSHMGLQWTKLTTTERWIRYACRRSHDGSCVDRKC